MLRSPHAHARIRQVNVSAAQALPGVLAAMTGAEFNALCDAQLPVAGVREHMKVVSRWPMAADTARYEGEPVAVVVAPDAYIARDALELIEVDYEPLPAVVDPERGLEDGAPIIHEELGTNLCVTSSRSLGDPDGGLYRRPTACCRCGWWSRAWSPTPWSRERSPPATNGEPGEVTLWLSTQAPHMERRAVAGVLGMRREPHTGAVPRRGRRLRGEDRHLSRNDYGGGAGDAAEPPGALGGGAAGRVHLHHPWTRGGAVRGGGLPQRWQTAGPADAVLHRPGRLLLRRHSRSCRNPHAFGRGRGLHRG